MRGVAAVAAVESNFRTPQPARGKGELVYRVHISCTDLFRFGGDTVARDALQALLRTTYDAEANAWRIGAHGVEGQLIQYRS
jgi:hypothetical protein